MFYTIEAMSRNSLKKILRVKNKALVKPKLYLVASYRIKIVTQGFLALCYLLNPIENF